MNTKITRNVLVDTFLAPSAAFDDLLQYKNQTLLALILIFALMIFSQLIFFSGMSPEWIVEQQLQLSGNISPAEANVLKKTC